MSELPTKPRTIEAIRRDLDALGRPRHPGVASVVQPSLVADWRVDLDRWRQANPGGEERYSLLCEEFDATEAHLAAVARTRRKPGLESVGMPKRVGGVLAALKPASAHTAVAQWLAGPKTWLLLVGTVGTGKSVAAGHACQLAVDQGKRALWVDAHGFSSRVGGFEGQRESRRLQSVDLLVLDDLGTEHRTDWVQALLHEVLLVRHEEQRKTVITANETGAQTVEQLLGPRLYDRVRSDCVQVRMTGQSLRGVRP